MGSVINNTQAKHILSLTGVTSCVLADECHHTITKIMCTSNWAISFHCYLSYQTSQMSGRHYRFFIQWLSGWNAEDLQAMTG